MAMGRADCEGHASTTRPWRSPHSRSRMQLYGQPSASTWLIGRHSNLQINSGQMLAGFGVSVCVCECVQALKSLEPRPARQADQRTIGAFVLTWDQNDTLVAYQPAQRTGVSSPRWLGVICGSEEQRGLHGRKPAAYLWNELLYALGLLLLMLNPPPLTPSARTDTPRLL